MQDDNDAAFRQLMRDAAALGMSGRDIVSCFSEWLMIDCWRFDGRDVHIFGNFCAVDEVVEVIEANGRSAFHGKIKDDARAQAREAFLEAMREKRGTTAHYPVKVDEGPLRDFVSIGTYRRFDDGTEGLIGVAFECFKPLRQIAISEEGASLAPAGENMAMDNAVPDQLSNAGGRL
ncbi:MAG TPA: hypothetical protein VN112_21365 [Ensifer sp.]|nr:hypothetical protein [Ensifer sp.]